MTDMIDRRTGQRPSLSRDVIADAAMELALRSPTAPITLSRLGVELGADPTALYRHYRSRKELILDVADRAYGHILDGVLHDPDWRVEMRGLAFAIREGLLRTPALTAELGLRFTGGENEMRLFERGREIMARAGLGGDLHLEVRSMGGLVMAHAVMTAIVLVQSVDDLTDDTAVAAGLGGTVDLPDRRTYEDQSFRRVLDVYVAGLEQLASVSAQQGTIVA